MKMHPNGDRTILPGTKAVKTEKSTVTVTLELPPQAYDLMVAMAPDEGCKEVADCILALLITAAAAWCEKYRDQDEIEDLFRPSRKETA